MHLWLHLLLLPLFLKYTVLSTNKLWGEKKNWPLKTGICGANPHVEPQYYNNISTYCLVRAGLYSSCVGIEACQESSKHANLGKNGILDTLQPLKLLRAHSRYICHETFSFMMSLPAMSLGLRFCVSRKGGTGEVGGCTQRVQTAWPRLGSSLEATWLALGGPFLSFLA